MAVARLNAKIDLAARQLDSADGVRYLSAGEVAMSEENLLAKNPAERNWDYFVQNLNWPI